MKSKLSHKEITEKDLVKDHKKLLTTYLKEKTTFDLKARKKILALYDTHIDDENIRYYINRNIKLFMAYLITGQIRRAAKYYPKGYLTQQP